LFLIYPSIARSTPPGCVGAAIPSAPLSLRLAPAATAVVEIVVVCKCKCKQNSINLCFGLPAVDDFAHGGIDSSNRGEFNVYDKKGGFNASLSCLKFVQPPTTNLEGKAFCYLSALSSSVSSDLSCWTLSLCARSLRNRVEQYVGVKL